ncbi:hypothetical protein LINGRAHAP2_LOCUS30946 [Linum grandiflorum]
MADHPSLKQDVLRLLQVLRALKQASHHLQSHPTPSSPAIKPLLDLHTSSHAILSNDPNLSSLSHCLSQLQSFVDCFNRSHRHTIPSFFSQGVSTRSISKIALSSLNLGFNRHLQDLVLKSRIFRSLHRILCDPAHSNLIREHCASSIAALIRFNKDVFAGFLAPPAIQSLVSIGSSTSIRVLISLIKSIKSPLVDEIEFNGEIPKIIDLLDDGKDRDEETKVLTVDCLMEMGYYGRKEAIEAMVKQGLIEKLVELQRSELGGDLIGMEIFDDDGGGEWKKKKKKKKDVGYIERHPFASCVARFSVQVEVGEGLRQREKRALKPEILRCVREGCVSEAEAATIVAEVLWGSTA